MKLPAIPGLQNFRGHAFHTARWDYAYTGGGPDEPITELTDKVVGLIGTGATGIQCLPALAAAAEHVYVFQRTPSAIGVWTTVRPIPPPPTSAVRGGNGPGWTTSRRSCWASRSTQDLVDDGWTRHYAAVYNPPKRKGMSYEEYIRSWGRGRLQDHGGASGPDRPGGRGSDRRGGPEAVLPLPVQAALLPRRVPGRFNEPNVTLIDCPVGFDRVSERGPVVAGQEYEVDCLVYGTGFEGERTPLARRAGHDIVGRGGVTPAEKWSAGVSSLFGMMTRGFPNLFIMPAPEQQSVVTVNYTQLALLGGWFIASTVSLLKKREAEVFDVSTEREAGWGDAITASFIDASQVMSACTPSWINNEGHPEALNPRNANYGGGFGDFFGYLELLERWLEQGDLEGLECVDGRTPRSSS